MSILTEQAPTEQVFTGSCLDILPTLPKASVQLVVTSPPYFNIKDYDHPDQIGFHDTYTNYLQRLQQVWESTNEVVEPGCKICINVGDQFQKASPNNPYQILPLSAEIIKQFQALPYTFLGSILWHKITNTTTSGGCAWMGSIYYPRDGYITYEHEYILLFRKNGKARKPSAKQKELSKLTKEQRSLWFRGLWDFPGERQSDHPAPFPLELPNRLIRMFSFHGETVLDPFCGSGTTLLAAQQSGRHSIGIELNPTYAEISRKRISQTCLL